jgi:hypothetical protein
VGQANPAVEITAVYSKTNSPAAAGLVSILCGRPTLDGRRWTAEQPQDTQQDYSTDKRDEQAPHIEAGRAGRADQAKQEATDKRADDPDDDVHQQALGSVRPHDDACQPT